MTDFENVLKQLAGRPRVIIAGGPRTGKTSLAVRASERFGIRLRHGDALVGEMEWSEASEEVARWFDALGEWIVEGVVAPRAIRKWMAANEGKKLNATVVYLSNPIQMTSKGQIAMAKGVETVWSEIAAQLEEAGVETIYPGEVAE